MKYPEKRKFQLYLLSKVFLFTFICFIIKSMAVDTLRLNSPEVLARALLLENLQDLNYLYINNIGCIENNIAFAVRTNLDSDKQIKILDFLHFDSVHGRAVPKIVGNLKRTGKTENVQFLKKGSMLFYGDSNCLRVYDVSDLKNPVEIDSAVCGFPPISSITIRNDTIFIGKEASTSFYPGIYIIEFTENQLSVKDSFLNVGGCGSDHFWPDKYFSFCGDEISWWDIPFPKEAVYNNIELPGSLMGWAFTMNDKYIFVAFDIGIIVYEINNSNLSIKPIDTLPATGVDQMRIYKNLLLTGGSQFHIFNISDIKNIEHQALYVVGNRYFNVDTTTDYVYMVQATGTATVDIIDIKKYVKPTPVIHKNSRNGFIINTNSNIRYSSTGHYLNYVNIQNNASLCILDPSGRIVQRFASLKHGNQTLFLNRNIKSGVYYAVEEGNKRVNCRFLINGK